MLILFGVHVSIYAIDNIFSFNKIVSSKQPVPKGKNISIVTVCIWLSKMVVCMVHIGANYDIANGLIEPSWQCNIGMIKL